MTPDAIFIGVATRDTIALLPRFPGADERVAVDDIVRAGGGPAATAAVAFARLGLEAAFLGAVGDDDEGGLILRELEDEGVDTAGAVRLSCTRSGHSLVLVDASRGTRAICNLPPPVLPDAAVPAARARLHGAAFVHVDQAGWPVLATLRSAAGRAHHPSVSVDAGNPIPGLALDGLDLFVPTLTRLRVLTDRTDRDAALDAALAAGAQWVVATDGSEGAIGASRDGARCAVPGYPVAVLSTLGAGDVFHGALLAARVRAFPLAEAVAYATLCAALSCRGLDGRSAIPGHDEVMERLPAFMDRVTCRQR